MDSACTVSEILKEVVEKLALEKNVETYSLYHVCPELDLEIVMKDTDNICDYMYTAENFAKPKGHHGKITWQFVFKKRVYRTNPNNMQPEKLDSKSLHLIYHQAVDEIVRGNQPIPKEHCMQLVALQLLVDQV